MTDLQENIAFDESIILSEKFTEGRVPDNLEISFEQYKRALYKSAKTFYDKADLDKSLMLFKASLKTANFPRDGHVAIKIYSFIIKIYSEMLDEEKAQDYILEASKYLELFGKELGSLSAEFFYHQGMIESFKRNYDLARVSYKQAYVEAKKENDAESQSKILLALAYNSSNLGNNEDAIQYITRLDELLSIIDKSYLKGAMYLFWSKLLAMEGFDEQALSKLDFASKQLQEKKCWNLFGDLLLSQGQIYKRKGDYETSLTYFRLARRMADPKCFRRLHKKLDEEIMDVNDNSIDLYLDKNNRKVVEKTIGVINFKHRFVLLEILFLLAKNSGQYFDKEALAKSIWGDEYNPLIHDKLIYTSVSRLRKLIEPKSGEVKRKYIIRGKDGYTFNPQAKIRFQTKELNDDNLSISSTDISSPI